jgi:hypothetical protein
MARKIQRKVKVRKLTQSAELEAYYQSGRWMAARKARELSPGDFGKWVGQEGLKLADSFPHPWPQVTVSRVNSYARILWNEARAVYQTPAR